MSDFSTFEHSYYIGSYMSGILYGVQVVMYYLTLSSLYRKKDNHNSPRSKKFFTIYTSILFFLFTLDIAINASWGEIMWINGREDPNGVLGWFAKNVTVWYQTMGSTCSVCMIFMGDALLLYRLFIIYGSNFYVIAFPCLTYLAGLALAIIQLILAGKPGGNFFHGKSINFGIPYYAITISLNVIITGLICFRLLRLGRAVSKALGRESARMYTSVASMLIESAAPYSMIGLMFLIPYALGSGTAIAFGQVWAKVTCLAPQLIVLRVVTGKAWGREVITQAQSNVEFMHRGSGGRSTGIELRTQTVVTHGNTTLGDNPSEKWAGSTKSLSNSDMA